MDIRAVEEVMRISDLINEMDNTRSAKTYKKREDPFAMYSDKKFRRKYRFSKAGVMVLDELFGASLVQDNRGLGLSSVLQILIALRCWGRNQVQDDAADIHGVTQQTVSTVCHRLAEAILEKRLEYIKMPTSLNEQLKNIQKFEALAGFKKVLGAIDCTHIRVPKVKGPSGQYYINRKGYSSLNVQVVCNATLKITNIVAHWRGSTHDSRIFNESRLKQCLERNQRHGRLLGDSGYACTPYLFTPLLNPSTRKEEAYNYAHIRTRNTIERCFGVWKNRFRCLLSGFRTSLKNTKMYIVALAVLHNIAIELNEEPISDDDDDDGGVILPQPTAPPLHQSTMRGAAARAIYIEENF